MWDVAIIGAGPAGCSAAITLARGGARVLLLERAAFPRPKLCGEFLSPEVGGLLESLGCGERFRAEAPARIERAEVFGRRSTPVRFPLPAVGYGLSRYSLDHLLADAARREGVELIENAEVAGLEGRALSLRDGRRFEAPRVLLAAGRHSFLQPAPRSRRTFFGFKAHYDGASEPSVQLYFFPGGYCGVAPVERGLVNVCALVEKKTLAGGRPDDLLAGSAALRERLGTLKRVEPFLHAGPVVLGWRRPMAGCLAAGDAALFVDPFTGDGIALALETGRLAARRLLNGGRAGDPNQFGGDLRARFGRQMRASRLLRLAAETPWLEPPLWPLLSRPSVSNAIFRLTRSSRLSG